MATELDEVLTLTRVSADGAGARAHKPMLPLSQPGAFAVDGQTGAVAVTRLEIV